MCSRQDFSEGHTKHNKGRKVLILKTKDGYMQVETIGIYQLPDCPELSRPVELVHSSLLENKGHPSLMTQMWHVPFRAIWTYSGSFLNYPSCYRTNNFVKSEHDTNGEEFSM